MAIDFTTTELIASVKRRITVPTSQNFFIPTNIIAFANDEQHQSVVPTIISVREEYFVTSVDQVITSTINTYRIPTRAVGGMLRDVVLVDSSGNEVGVPRLQPEVTKSESSLTSVSQSGIVVKDDSVVLYPSAQAFTQTTLRFKFMRMPNNLILSSQAGRILGINTSTNEVTLSTSPTSWSTATTFDVIRDTPTFTSVGDDQTITAIAPPVLTFTTLPTNIAVGQWVAEARTSPVPQFPYEAHQYLAQMTAASMLSATGDKKNAEVAMEKAKSMKESLLQILTPRIEGSNKKVNSRTGLFNYTGSQPYTLGV